MLLQEKPTNKILQEKKKRAFRMASKDQKIKKNIKFFLT